MRQAKAAKRLVLISAALLQQAEQDCVSETIEPTRTNSWSQLNGSLAGACGCQLLAVPSLEAVTHALFVPPAELPLPVPPALPMRRAVPPVEAFYDQVRVRSSKQALCGRAWVACVKGETCRSMGWAVGPRSSSLPRGLLCPNFGFVLCPPRPLYYLCLHIHLA